MAAWQPALSTAARVGQSVLAIGNPFGLDWTLTTGIVSATRREISSQASGKIEGLIQTDAAINPGNSGGALIDSSGKLLGVNTAIYSPSGTSAGIGFAIPADTVARVVPQLIEKGHYSPPYLGVVTDPRFDLMLSKRGIVGVAILAVDEGSPAAAAGLRHAQRARNGTIMLGDVIVGVDGKRISTRADLDRALDARAPGSELELEIRRGDRTTAIVVKLANPR